jgi:hypothetical protein
VELKSTQRQLNVRQHLLYSTALSYLLHNLCCIRHQMDLMQARFPLMNRSQWCLRNMLSLLLCRHHHGLPSQMSLHPLIRI